MTPVPSIAKVDVKIIERIRSWRRRAEGIDDEGSDVIYRDGYPMGYDVEFFEEAAHDGPTSDRSDSASQLPGPHRRIDRHSRPGMVSRVAKAQQPS